MRPIPRRQIRLCPGILGEVVRCLRRGTVGQGPEIARFEAAMAGRLGVRQAIGVASARVGLRLVADAVGLHPGDAVLCSAYTFHAMPQALRAVGLTPVFVDTDPDTWTLDPAALEAVDAPRVRALLVTHLFGQPCAMEPITAWAQRRGVALLEDCAHALGATVAGRSVGTFGTAGLFSFGAGKALPCCGGGLITTDDDGLAQRLRAAIARGAPPAVGPLLAEVAKTAALAWGTSRGGFALVGYPALRAGEALRPGLVDRLMQEAPRAVNDSVPRGLALANLQAAVGLRQLPLLDGWLRARQAHAEGLDQALAGLVGLQRPAVVPGTASAWLYYRVLVNDRARFRRALLRAGVDTKPDDMTNCGGPDYPVAARVARTSVELPTDPSLTGDDLRAVAAAVRQALAI